MAHADHCCFVYWLDDEASALREIANRIRCGVLTDPTRIAQELEVLASGGEGLAASEYPNYQRPGVPPLGGDAP